MKTLKNFYRRHKKAFLIISVILVTALVVGFLASTTSLIGRISNSNLFNNRDRNEDNLISVSAYEELDGDKFSGVEFTVDEDGVITLNGKAKDDTTITLANITVSNNKPQYYFFSGSLGGDLDSYYMTLECAELATYCVMRSVCCDDTQGLYFEPFGEVYHVKASIVIKEGTELNNVKFYPVLSSGEQIDYFE